MHWLHIIWTRVQSFWWFLIMLYIISCAELSVFCLIYLMLGHHTQVSWTNYLTENKIFPFNGLYLKSTTCFVLLMPLKRHKQNIHPIKWNPSTIIWQGVKYKINSKVLGSTRNSCSSIWPADLDLLEYFRNMVLKKCVPHVLFASLMDTASGLELSVEKKNGTLFS